MDMKNLLDLLLHWLTDLMPSLIGAATAQAWKPALPLRQRILQWIVGSTVSYYVTLALVDITHWSGFVAQSIAFGVAMIAFDATPRLTKALIETLASLPKRLADRFLPGKDK